MDYSAITELKDGKGWKDGLVLSSDKMRRHLHVDGGREPLRLNKQWQDPRFGDQLSTIHGESQDWFAAELWP